MGFVTHLQSGSYEPQPRWKTFFDDGTVFADLPAEGLTGFDRAASRARRRGTNYWLTYTMSGSAGVARAEETAATWKLLLVKPGELKIDGDVFHRCSSVDNLRLDGAWTSYGKDDPGLDQLPVGQRPVIHFTREGRFIDDGLFATFLKSGGDDHPGSGRYELKDFTLILKYDDGRVRHEAFSGLLGADPAVQDGRVYIRRSAMTKRAKR